MSEHNQHEMHENSLKANREERSAGRFENRAALIEGVYRATKDPLTDREVMHALSFADPNAVRPRINELIEKKILEEVDSVRCPETGKTVRRCRIRTAEPPEPAQPAAAAPVQASLFG